MPGPEGARSLSNLPLSHLEISTHSDCAIPDLPRSLLCLVLVDLDKIPFTFTKSLDLPKLRSLHLQLCTLTPTFKSYIADILHNDFFSLTLWESTPPLSDDRLHDLLWHIRPSLRHLAIIPLTGTGPDPQVLARFPRLSTLFYDYPTSDTVHEPTLLLPRTLERLQIHEVPSVAMAVHIAKQLGNPDYFPALSHFPIVRCNFLSTQVTQELHTQVIKTGHALLSRGLQRPRADWIRWRDSPTEETA